MGFRFCLFMVFDKHVITLIKMTFESDTSRSNLSRFIVFVLLVFPFTKTGKNRKYSKLVGETFK